MTLAEKLIVAYTSMALVFSVGSANVAQLVEQRIRNAWVAGSSPAVGSIEFAGQSFMRLAFLFSWGRAFCRLGKRWGRSFSESLHLIRQGGNMGTGTVFPLNKQGLACVEIR